MFKSLSYTAHDDNLLELIFVRKKYCYDIDKTITTKQSKLFVM